MELRAEVSGNVLVGHAAVFGQSAEVRGGYERLARTAFDEALKTSDARFLLNHDPSALLGRQGSGTLRLSTDNKGLLFEVDLPDTQLGRDVRTLVGRGDLNAGSFGFIPGTDKFTTATDGKQIRTHTSIKSLLDASLVTYPAYSGTDAQLRNMNIETRPPSGRSQLIRARAQLLTGGRI